MRLALMLACLFVCATTHAQSLPAALMVRPALLEPRDPALRLPPLDRDLLETERHSRMMLATGVGVLVSTLAFSAVAVSNDGCGPARTATLVSAAVVGGIGLTLTLRGGWRMSHEPGHARASGSRQVAMSGAALASALAAQAVMFSGWLGGAVQCFH